MASSAYSSARARSISSTTGSGFSWAVETRMSFLPRQCAAVRRSEALGTVSLNAAALSAFLRGAGDFGVGRARCQHAGALPAPLIDGIVPVIGCRQQSFLGGHRLGDLVQRSNRLRDKARHVVGLPQRPEARYRSRIGEVPLILGDADKIPDRRITHPDPPKRRLRH